VKPLHVLNVMVSHGVGGTQFAFVRYGQLFERLGYDLTWCVTQDAAVNGYLPPSAKAELLPRSVQFSPLGLYRAVQSITRTAPDVIVTHGRRAFTTFAMARRFAKRKPALAVVLHRHVFKGLNAAEAIICVSADIAAAAPAHGIRRDKLFHIPNFVDVDIRADAPAPHAPPVIGYLGRMVPEKGLDLLLDALKLVKARGIAFKLVIAGDGPLQLTLQAKAVANGIAEHITWHGWLDETRPFFDTIDLLVVPSRSESFGLVTVEAFAAGRPVLATRTSGSRGLIDSGKNGLLCEIAPDAIADGIATLLAQPELRAALVRQAMADVRRYTPEAVAPQVDACLREVVSGRR
jgi:glycosyltransferase involved in cell wall biosynthesis